MAVDVVDAVAAVSGALGAVAELQIRVIHVGAAADAALVQVPGLFLGLLRRPPEVDGPAGVLVPGPLNLAPQSVQQAVSEEHQVVQDGQHRQQGKDIGALGQQSDHAVQEQSGVQIGQPLDLHRQDEEEQYHHVGKQGGKGEKQGQVYVFHGCRRNSGNRLGK